MGWGVCQYIFKTFLVSFSRSLLTTPCFHQVQATVSCVSTKVPDVPRLLIDLTPNFPSEDTCSSAQARSTLSARGPGDHRTALKSRTECTRGLVNVPYESWVLRVLIGTSISTKATASSEADTRASGRENGLRKHKRSAAKRKETQGQVEEKMGHANTRDVRQAKQTQWLRERCAPSEANTRASEGENAPRKHKRCASSENGRTRYRCKKKRCASGGTGPTNHRWKQKGCASGEKV